jgi:hypothetical protein
LVSCFQIMKELREFRGHDTNLRHVLIDSVLIDRVGFTEKKGSESRKPGTRGGA